MSCVIVANGRRILHNIQVIAIVMTKGRIIVIICVAIFLSSSFRAYVVSIDTSTTAEILNQETHVKNAQGNNSSMDIGNYSKGGYHLATGMWSEPSSASYFVMNNDSDGDGINNLNDMKPLTPRRSLLGMPILNWSDYTFSPAWSSSDLEAESGGGRISTLDVNDDGRLDVITKSRKYLTDENGLAQSPSPSNSGVELVFDGNSDGELDYLVTNGGDWTNANGHIEYSINNQIYNSNHSFQVSTGTANGGTATMWSTFIKAEVGDINADGKIDIALLFPNSFQIYLQNNTGIELTPSISINTSVDLHSRGFKLVDIDGDYDLDIAFFGIGFENISSAFPTDGDGWLENSNGTFTSERTGGCGGGFQAALDFFDFDRDGDQDLLCIESRGGFGQLYQNDGNGSFSLNWTSNRGYYGDNMYGIGDLNNDGWEDLILVEGNSPHPVYYSGNKITIYLNILGNLEQGWVSDCDTDNDGACDIKGIALGDFDGDYDLDIFIASRPNHILLNANQSFDLEHTLTPYSDQNSAYGDYDQDGDLDFVTVGPSQGNSCSGCLLLYKNIGNNQFSSSPIWSSSPIAELGKTNFKWANLSGDGNLELIVSLWQSTNYIFSNINGSLSSNPVWNTSLSDTSSWSMGRTGLIHTFDVDLDGDLDLLITGVSGCSGNTNRIFLNNNGTIDANASISWPDQMTIDVESEDLNGDSYPELIILHACNNRISIHNNTAGIIETTSIWGFPHNGGSYSFNHSSYIHMPNTVNSQFWQVYDENALSMGDADGDGDVDLSIGRNIYENNNGILTKEKLLVDSNLSGPGTLFRDEPMKYSLDGYIHEIIPQYDNDYDGFFDSQDSFPNDPTQAIDFESDGYGDNPLGRYPDSCVGDWGDSWRDRWGCTDLDKDGQSDLYDDYINKPTQWVDSDGDGLGDNWGDVSINATRPTHWPGQWFDSAYNPDPFPLDFDNDGKEDEGLNGSQGPFDDCPYTYGTSTIDRVGCIDSDSDGFSDPDSNWGVLDGADNFPSEQTQWNDSDDDGYGDNQAGKDADAYPDDSTQWSDFDDDGYGDNPNGTNADAFSFDPTQWDDRDGDGYGDNPSPASQPDACPDIAGTSTKDGYGCLDADGDGWGLTDNCPNEAGNSTADKIGCSDVDGDDWSDSGDYDLDDPTVWSNIDGDEYPDQGGSTTLDSCPNEFGTSWLDRLGCADPDGDGWSSADGGWFIHPLGLADSHPTDASQWRDRDGDGYGDNQTGTNPDACPDLNGESKWNIVDGLRVSMLGCADNDGDGYTDDIDDCPIAPGSSSGITWGCPDSDGDGIQDVNDDCPSQLGSSNANLKACPDSDGDGIADLEDPYPLTSLSNNGTITDWDGDGYENSNDSFVFEETQWNDTDGDGLGDNSAGNNPDPYPNDRDNDGYDDPDDYSTNEKGCLINPQTGKDAFPSDNREWIDSDGDCLGNNADSDDDNDGYSDNAELQAGTDPLSADSKPTESFEIVVPGTSIGLGAWDLIGMFGGIPLFAWLAFGFVTRNRRAGKFEDQLRQAKSRDELEQIALRSEYSLMLRLIGPHQGIRLERLRAELDDVLESVQRPLDPMDQTSIVEASMSSGQELKSITPLPDEGPSLFATGITDEDGYEWLDHNGLQYYRSAGSDVGWNKWEN